VIGLISNFNLRQVIKSLVTVINLDIFVIICQFEVSLMKPELRLLLLVS
jgi:hypothetical protein